MILLCLSVFDREEDKERFAQIYSTYYMQMYHMAHSIVQNDADAEDVVHDVFFKIAEKYMSVINNIKNDADLKNYLLKSAKNAAINKTKASERTYISLDSIIENGSDYPIFSDDTFLETICAMSERDSILDAIESLDKKYSDVLYYHFVLGLSIPQTAKHLNQKVSTIKQRLVRGKQQLLSKLNITGE